MARTVLGWGVRDLAEKSGASPDTVSRFERGEELRADTVQRFRDQFEHAGVIFIDADETAGEGVRLRKPKRKKGTGR